MSGTITMAYPNNCRNQVRTFSATRQRAVPFDPPDHFQQVMPRDLVDGHSP